MTTADQVLKLIKMYERNHEELSNALSNLIDRVSALELNVRSLHAGRHNKRYELKMETPVFVAGDTYELPSSYDSNALFVVFNPVVKVQEAALTLAPTSTIEPESKRFESVVPLVPEARVIYFERIPGLTTPSFP
jgi:hypothetical protein